MWELVLITYSPSPEEESFKRILCQTLGKHSYAIQNNA